MKTLRVRDIMTTRVQTLDPGASAADAARLLSLMHVTGAPVLDGERIVGVVTLTDLVARQGRPAGGAEPAVDAFMTRVLYAVRPSDPVMLAVRLMVDQSVHRAVVVDDDGALAGIVTPMDVLRALARGKPVQANDFPDGDEPVSHGDPAVAVSYVDLRTLEYETH